MLVFGVCMYVILEIKCEQMTFVAVGLLLWELRAQRKKHSHHGVQG
jgi:hypothetical protein